MSKIEHLLKRLKGTTIEPLVPLLTFIGGMGLDKSIENKMSPNNSENRKQTKVGFANSNKKRAFHL